MLCQWPGTVGHNRWPARWGTTVGLIAHYGRQGTSWIWARTAKFHFCLAVFPQNSEKQHEFAFRTFLRHAAQFAHVCIGRLSYIRVLFEFMAPHSHRQPEVIGRCSRDSTRGSRRPVVFVVDFSLDSVPLARWFATIKNIYPYIYIYVYEV